MIMIVPKFASFNSNRKFNHDISEVLTYVDIFNWTEYEPKSCDVDKI